MVGRVRAICIRLLFLLAAFSLLLPQLARADVPSSLLVVGGGATEHDRTTIGGAIERAVRGEGWLLPPKPATKKEADGLLNCQDSKAPWTCVPTTISAKGIRNIFVVSVDASQAANGAPLVVITGRLLVTDPPSFAFVQRFCEHCADDKLIEAGGELARQLIQDLAVRGGRTVVHFTSEPSTAEIILDGNKLGVTEATYDTFPGKHVAMIQKAGYISEVREFTVDQGKTAELAFKLRPSAPATDTPPGSTKRTRSLLVPGLLIGSGGALALLGGAVLVRGQQTDSGKYTYSRATAVGLTTGLIGLGTVAAGLYLLWRDPGSGPTASIAPGTAVVGWSGRF